MSADVLRGLIDADSFFPFTLRLNDGRKIRVPHRSFITLSKDGRTFTTFGGAGACDTIQVVLVASCQLDDGKTLE